MQIIKSCKIGCQLKGIQTNIVAFADDILLMCPSKTGLQYLVDLVSSIFDRLCLKLNANKSKYIVFRHESNLNFFGDICIDNSPVERVSVLKYLGVLLSEDFKIKADCDRALKSFFKQFNSMYNKFNFLPIEVLSFLFKTYATSFYGIHLWFEQRILKTDTKKLEVAYHKAIKKVVGLEVWRSNHDACEKMGIDVFKHLLSKRMINFYFSAISSNCRMFRKLKYHFMLSSQLYRFLKHRFLNLYQINEILGNDKNALLSRVGYVQRNEPRSNYVYEPAVN